MNRKENITLFKCPSRKMKDLFNNIWQIPCLSDLHYDVLAILSDWSIVDPDIVYCTKIHDYSEVASIDSVVYQEYILLLNWYNPTCKFCEAKGKYCRFKMNTIDSETECYGSIKPTKDDGLGFNDCNTSSCGSFGPPVRFPFRIRGKQPLHCGYPQPGFHLSCSEKNDTVLELPNSWKLFVQEIDYKSQVIYANDSGGCLPRRLILNLNASVSPFELMNERWNITLFKCPSRKLDVWINYIWRIPCLSGLHYDVVAIVSYVGIYDANLLYCTKIHDYSEVAYWSFLVGSTRRTFFN
ncbi:hypothetical protein GH714_008313 [Hevea brasiliensis]|uniref:RING-type E3 ubiquitin transferase n=1 Tax=Hevea brasiliensis TaxID=3981 RepID=A0A6A6NCS6_HEVBR|nr:hypothetical protein GH714_008294 [Hevea brasiliensis]KAF2322189.1 hypothetical protein GH714_008313 [Hevea brasiliensis]